MPYKSFGILLSAALLAISVAPARANLVTDPGFESCTTNGSLAPGWTSSDNSGCGSNSHTDSWANNFPEPGGTLSQTVATVTGDNYDFSFWLEGEIFTPDHFAAFFGSDEVLLLGGIDHLGYTLQDFAVTATGASTTISFSGFDAEGAWNLDDVSITDVTAPEPASLILFGTGLLGIAWRFRRQRA